MPFDNVKITADFKKNLTDFFKDNHYTNIAVVVDENTAKHCYPIVKNTIPAHHLIQIKSGEKHKNLNTCEIIWTAITEAHFDRKSLLINLGGGVIGDMGGFCASTFKRGIDFVNIPTTLLAQVDASVGGKLGIDFNNLKNHIGLFNEPKMVLIDAVFLKTLPENQLKSGYAEVIKHSLIRDADYWETLTKNTFETQNWQAHIAHDVAIKSQVVAEDPHEKGLRKILNFGHTVGHAVESYLFDNPSRLLLHGEAIAVGMICEAYLSKEKLGLAESQLKEIIQYILSVYDKVEILEEDIANISKLALQDKKNEGDIINCTLLTTIGAAQFDVSISLAEIEKSLKYYQQLKSID